VTYRDEHLVPGRGAQPCAPLLERLAAGGYAGAVVLEVNTRRAPSRQARLADLAEALAFTREHLGLPPASGVAPAPAGGASSGAAGPASSGTADQARAGHADAGGSWAGQAARAGANGSQAGDAAGPDPVSQRGSALPARRLAVTAGLGAVHAGWTMT
jgi:hypothetical protein